MKATIGGVHIAGIATVVPPKVVTTDSYADFFGEKKIRRIKRSTGVESVHVVENGVTASDLCFEAAKKLIDNLAIDRGSIDAIVFVSFSPDYRAPGTAGILQGRLGLSEEVVAIDLNFGCSGYIYGLYEASLLLKGGCKRVLLCAGDTQSTLVNEKDRSMKMLVGDAGSATIVEEGIDTMQFYFKTIGSDYESLIIPAGGCRIPSSDETKIEIEDEDGNVRSKEDLYMNGMGVMKFALTEVPLAMEKMYEMTGWEKDEVDLFAYHQPNKLILDYLSNAMEISSEKMPVGLQTVGNTASASIPLLLTTLYNRGFEFNDNKKIIACGFGIGLSIGALNINLEKTQLFS